MARPESSLAFKLFLEHHITVQSRYWEEDAEWFRGNFIVPSKGQAYRLMLEILFSPVLFLRFIFEFEVLDGTRHSLAGCRTRTN